MGELPNTELPVPGVDVRSRNRTGVGRAGPNADRSADRELSRAVRQFELPIALIELDDFTVLAVSDAALELLGTTASAVVGHRYGEKAARLKLKIAWPAFHRIRGGTRGDQAAGDDAVGGFCRDCRMVDGIARRVGDGA